MNNDFKRLCRLFIDICLFKKGPSQVPNSAALLRIVFFLYFVAGTLLLSQTVEFSEAMAQAFMETLLVGFFMYLLVSFFAVKNRFNQSVTALYGSGFLMTTMSLPFVLMMGDLTDNEASTGWLGLSVFMIVFWSFIVMAHIIRETIEKTFSVSLLLTFCYLYLSYQVIQVFRPL